MPDTPHQPPPGSTPGTPGITPDQPAPPDAQSVRTLSEDDGRALDALLAARAEGADQGPTPPWLGERTEKLTDLLGLLDQDTTPDPEADLTARTMQAIRNQQQRKRFADQVQMLSTGTGGSGDGRRSLGFDWRQLATAVAVFLIAASLLMPVMERQQADSRRVVGAGRLGTAGRAMGTYAADNLGQMPRRDVRPGEVWWEVGQRPSASNRYVRSNSAHLFILFSQGYASVEDLTCPENEHADEYPIDPTDMDWTGPRAVSFSYQNQYTPHLLRLDDDPTMAVLADRNPLFEVVDNRIVFNPNTSKLAPSRAHRGMGQNVLSANGVVTWGARPLIDPINGNDTDNIWTAEGIDFYYGNETPAERSDSFLVP